MMRPFSRAAARLIYPLVKGRRDGLRILCYHAVNDLLPDYMNVRVSNFEDQMAWLASEGYTTVSLDTLFDERGKGDMDWGKRVVITFDDGYRDNYENAFPVMLKYGFTGAIFCVSGKIGTDPYLDRAQILEMQKAGFSFGSHTVTHPRLSQTAPEVRKAEFRDSKKVLEELLGSEVSYFCYPYGIYEEACFNELKEAGYRAAVSNTPGANRPGQIANPYTLCRTEIGGFDTLEDFKLKTAGAFDLLHGLLHKVRGRP